MPFLRAQSQHQTPTEILPLGLVLREQLNISLLQAWCWGRRQAVWQLNSLLIPPLSWY